MPRFTPIQLIALLGVVLIALNLRAPFTSVAPVLEQIMHNLSLSASKAGLITALPLFALALFSPIAPKISHKFGLTKALVLALICIALGVAIRSIGSISPLYIGTMFLGAGIAFGNVLLPAVVKEHFPQQISPITSLYVFVMGAGATLASSLMVPLSHLSPAQIQGWQFALLFNLLFPIAALMFWLPKLKSKIPVPNPNQGETKHSALALLKSPIAWFVTLALGINSFTFYSFAGWLPKILNDLGYSELDAGYIYGFLQFSTMVPGLLLVPILARFHNHVLLIGVCAGSVVLSLIGLILSPELAIMWVAIFGLANCSTFIIAMSFVGLRTNNTRQAASLSGIAQSLGYALAATGPSLIGYAHTKTQGWLIPVLIIAAFGSACTIFAMLAARKRLI
jgi:CP family cyanate transporter-like MFS transporter